MKADYQTGSTGKTERLD